MRAVHREAQYYAIGPLLDSLEDAQPLTGERVRQSFLDLMPYYKGDWLSPLSHTEQAGWFNLYTFRQMVTLQPHLPYTAHLTECILLIKS